MEQGGTASSHARRSRLRCERGGSQNARIHKELQRDEYAWQKEEGIRNTYEKRAEGLHHILYQCPHCKKEFEMYSKGTKLWCNACKKVWEMSELG